MKKIIKQIINTIQKTITKNDFQNKYKSKPVDFTRTRKLSFKDVILFVIGLTNTSFDFENINFCNSANIESISTAALSKARDKINFNAFRELLIITQQIIPTANKYKDYRIIAVDGVKGELPNTPELREKCNISAASKYPQFHAVASFDVLNCKFLDAEIQMKISNERKLAYELINKHLAENDIFLFDRGFPSIALIQILENKNLKFVARVTKSFLKEVNDFSSQKVLDKVVHIDYTSERKSKSNVKNIEVPYSFDLRCVKIKLSSGKTEVLITNLTKNIFSRSEIAYLYGLRWGIETSFNHLKNAINIEEFVGIKENSIKQEFYSILLKYNLVTQYVGEAEYMSDLIKKNYKIRL